MSIRRKQVAITTLALVAIYGLTPFVAGLVKTHDSRGPKIFLEGHHEFLYRLGYYLAGHHRHDGKPRVLSRQERPWFYGMEGERTPEPQRF